MDWSRDSIRNLREILARLYPQIGEATRIVTDAGLDPTRIATDPKAITNWFNILEHAQHRQGKIDAILQIALKDCPDNDALKRASDGAPPPMLHGPETTDWHGPHMGSQLEKLMAARSTLVPISYLETGLRCARAVVRIVTSDGACGTGFVVAGDFVITNHHVLPSASIAVSAVIQFNYQQTASGANAPIEQYKLAPERLFKTSSADDWTVVQIDGTPSSKWGGFELKPIPICVGDHVNIIQHPGGGPKQLSFLANVVVFVGSGRVQYLTDTLPGSSGSPVFDTSWNLVAIHHSGGWLSEPNAPNKTTYYRNEGILVERVMMAFTQ
jgi:V8-like Glu-specific endopeptidase